MYKYENICSPLYTVFIQFQYLHISEILKISFVDIYVQEIFFVNTIAGKQCYITAGDIIKLTLLIKLISAYFQGQK